MDKVLSISVLKLVTNLYLLPFQRNFVSSIFILFNHHFGGVGFSFSGPFFQSITISIDW
jgi:hypothetical protein